MKDVNSLACIDTSLFMQVRKVLSAAKDGVEEGMHHQSKERTRRSVEHCTPHADGAWLNELGWSQ